MTKTTSFVTAAALFALLLIIAIASVRAKIPICDATLRITAPCLDEQHEGPKSARVIDDPAFWHSP